MLFEIKEVDKAFYQERLAGFLPERIIDIHAHVWLDSMISPSAQASNLLGSWPLRVAKDNSIEDLFATYELLFDGKKLTPLIFTHVIDKDNLDELNGYTAGCAEKHGLGALAVTRPDWDREKFESVIRRGGFFGAKVYGTFAADYIPADEIRIFDFLPHHQLESLNKFGWIVMLHIPRTGRLKDPVNLAQLLEIEERYPKVKLIIAHIGRAYCPEDVGNAFEVLGQTRNMMFDFSANTNAEIFEKTIKTFGPQRILFGSDMPITRMRMRRVCENGNYINIVPQGLYGDVSGDKNMREVAGKEAQKLSFFIYEEIDAFRRVAEKTQLSRGDIEDVFYNNARQLIEFAKPKNKYPQLQMIWPQAKLAQAPTWTMPQGYTLKTYGPQDEEEYLALMRLAGFTYWTEEVLKETLASALPGGLVFVVHDKTKKIVATTVACHRGYLRGELGWVAADPDHQGKGLGYVVCSAVIKCFLEAGYREIYLQTDDFRLPAIKIYLNLGFEPVLSDADMRQRWGKVLGELHWKT